ncbi:peptidase S46 [bacterium BMS3Abin03]|nr:peptidase S46 [bacterium BMS3Abin03]
MKKILMFLFVAVAYVTVTSAQGNNSWLNLDTVKAGRFDTGKMWTFEYPPVDYFNETYNFEPDQEWFDDVRMSALRFASYCSASFVSADGLVMTNHHCARPSISKVTQEGENLHENGFIANTLEDERPVPGLYVDQLVLIKDVTDEIQDAMEEGKTNDEKLSIKSKMFEEIETRTEEETGLVASVTPLYNGGRYSLYGYERYTDVRLVFVPEQQMGYFGGDPDNFTYPRYNLDCAFFRVYDDNGEPLKTDHYFSWSDHGAEVNEPVFVVGNPGSTNRLRTVAQLEYNRDIIYPRTIELIKGLIDVYSSMLKEQPERKLELEDRLFSFQNSLKAYTGMLKGLRNPVLMQRKKDFEKKFRAAVNSDPELKDKYGNLWNNIAEIRKDLKEISNERFALSLNRFVSPAYFSIAEEVIEIADQLKLPEDERDALYVGDELDNTLHSLFPEDFDYEMNNKLLKEKIKMWYEYLGADNEILKKITGGKKGDEAVAYMLSHSVIINYDDIKKLVDEGPDAILNSDDPFIYFVQNTKKIKDSLDARAEELTGIEDVYNEELGRALFEVYGTSIPPDATFTLRISDGVVKGFRYNGTIAPPYTTFYGLYDRYYSFGKKFPWDLPERWKNPPDNFDLSTKFNFVSTNDIIGGNSGSAIINEDAEIVGLAFDGNIQGLPGNFIFRTEENRTVGVHSQGMLEAIMKVYKLKRLADELQSGHISD